MESATSWQWDLVGLPFTEARQILAARGQTYETVVIAPPKRPHGVGDLRVVAERSVLNGLQLVLAYRSYEPPTP